MVKVTKKVRVTVEDFLAFTGQTLRGAKEGAKALLGKKTYCIPIVVNEVQGMYTLFPGPVNKADTVYFMLNV